MAAIMRALLYVRKEGRYLPGIMQEGDIILAYPDIWRDRAVSLAGPVSLDLAGHSTTIELTDAQLERVSLPLLAIFDARSTAGRIVVGLAGVPGGGKSTAGAILQRVADQLWGPGRLVLVAMDGWHYPNAVLDRLTTRTEDGRTVPLRQRKGGPESYDVPALAAAIRQLKRADAACRLPVYSRKLHDPVAEAVEVPADTRIVLVEGNFLLSSESPWDTVSRLLDVKCYLDSCVNEARARVLARHVRGGLSHEQAVAKYEINDRLNTDAVLATRGNAEVMIRMDGADMGVHVRRSS